MFNYKIGENNFMVELSSHASDRLKKENFNQYQVYGCLVYITDKIMGMEVGEEFVIVDADGNSCVVASKKSQNVISIITVTLNSMVFVKKGIRLFDLLSILDKNDS